MMQIILRNFLAARSEIWRCIGPLARGKCARYQEERCMIRKLKSGKYRLYSRKKDEHGHRRNLGTFGSRRAAEKHERAVQYFKHH
jgi:hypothetical protein